MKEEITGYAIVDKDGLIVLGENKRPWISTDFVIANRWLDNVLSKNKQIEIKTVKIIIQH